MFFNLSIIVLLSDRLKGFCKIEVRHVLFKKICFFDFLK
jgi:hypothetical protein